MVPSPLGEVTSEVALKSINVVECLEEVFSFSSFLEYAEELDADLVGAIEVLQAAQELGNIIAGSEVEFDPGDVVLQGERFEASHGDEDWGKIAGEPSMLKTGCVSKVNDISNIEDSA